VIIKGSALAESEMADYLFCRTEQDHTMVSDIQANFLDMRCHVQVSGADAADFLQGLITTNVVTLPEGQARPGALLTPQGKIMFDFLISREPQGFTLETDISQRDGLVRRLLMYRLRAAVEIVASPVVGTSVSLSELPGAVKDHRFALAGLELWRLAGQHGSATAPFYSDMRIAAGIVESGSDYALSDVFPHDVLMDLNGGVSFKKGCYVGQEVVSRMQHRSTARRRVVIVSSTTALPPSETQIMADGKPVGSLGSVSGNQGLAIVRIDKAGDAMHSGIAITAGDVVVSLALPQWSGLVFPTTSSPDEASA
jgi:tRNA-modifying protein YgfZ